jgi:ribosomal protein S18 acetylase RimI-like enzyme
MSLPPELPGIFQFPDGEEILIRPIRETDLPALEWEGQYQHFRRLYAEHFEAFKAGTTLIYIAETSSGQMVGQVFLLLYSRSKEIADGRRRAYLFSFRIKPAYRNQGLGSYMLSYVENQLLLRGFLIVRLNVAQDNPRARELYERHGYQVIGYSSGVWQYQDDQGVWKTVREPAWKMIKRLR